MRWAAGQQDTTVPPHGGERDGQELTRQDLPLGGE
jgi:hypothetical protein